ncbi:MAG: hypothetical protein IKO32_04400, partial [Lachnospiraceae bacterium]|nr:hypothetical protein [Lachnospiraceae bacterium]
MSKSLKKTVITLVVCIAAIIVLSIFLSSTLYTVHVNESAIIIRLGRIQAIESNPGLHVHAPFIESVTGIYTGDILYDIPVSDVITS